MRLAGRVALFLAVIAVVWVAVYFHIVLVHLSQLTGTSNSSSRAYDFWSGFGSDLAELTLIGGAVAAYRHHNCHVARCPRLGKPVEGTPYTACPKHHPAHEGDKRGVDVATIHAAHRSHKARILRRTDEPVEVL